MKALLLGARGAVGTVIQRELLRAGHQVTAAGRSRHSDAVIDLSEGTSALSAHAPDHDVVVNASGVERVDLAGATGSTPLVEISATGSYLEALRDAGSAGPLVLGAGLVPGLSTVLIRALHADPDDEIDLFVMLGSGEQHGPAAVEWTAGLVGTDLHRPPEGGTVRNLTSGLRTAGPDGRTRRYLRADFPDHILLGGEHPRQIRSYLTLSSGPMTTALALVGRFPVLRGTLTASPHIGSDAWHLLARNRRTGEQISRRGHGQSTATGRFTALAAIRAAASPPAGPVTMADLLSLADIDELPRD